MKRTRAPVGRQEYFAFGNVMVTPSLAWSATREAWSAREVTDTLYDQVVMFPDIRRNEERSGYTDVVDVAGKLPDPRKSPFLITRGLPIVHAEMAVSSFEPLPHV